MNTNRQLIEQFLQFINTGDTAIGKDFCLSLSILLGVLLGTDNNSL